MTSFIAMNTDMNTFDRIADARITLADTLAETRVAVQRAEASIEDLKAELAARREAGDTDGLPKARSQKQEDALIRAVAYERLVPAYLDQYDLWDGPMLRREFEETIAELCAAETGRPELFARRANVTYWVRALTWASEAKLEDRRAIMFRRADYLNK